MAGCERSVSELNPSNYLIFSDLKRCQFNPLMGASYHKSQNIKIKQKAGQSV